MKHDYFTLPGFSFRLRPCSLSIALFLLVFLLNFTLGFGQGVPFYDWEKVEPMGQADIGSLDQIVIATATDTEDNIYALKFGGDVLVFDSNGNPNGSFQLEGSFEGLVDMAISSNNEIYVAHYEGREVRVFDLNGNELLAKRKSSGYFKPLGLTFDQNDNLYILDYNDGTGAESSVSSRLKIYYDNGTVSSDLLINQLTQPYRIAVAASGDVYISHAANNGETLVFDKNFTFLQTMPSLGSPGSIEIDDAGFIYIIDYSDKVDFAKILEADPIYLLSALDDIKNGIQNSEFSIKLFNSNNSLEKSLRDKIQLPLDLTFTYCTNKMGVNNTNIEGRLFSTKLVFDLELYDRTPSLDTEEPEAICKSGLEFTLENGEVTITAEEIDGGSADNCEIKSLELSQYTFENTGDFPVTLTVTDAAGNFDTCETTITILPGDEELFIDCPGTQTADFQGNCEFELLDYTGDADFTSGANVTQSPVAGTFITENTEITLTAELDGETQDCTFIVEATNKRSALAVSCPGDQTEEADTNNIFEIPDYTYLANVTNSCGNINVTQSPTAGTVVEEDTTVTLSVVDERGVSIECEFEVILNFQEELFIDCPGTQIADFQGNCEFELLDYTGNADFTSGANVTQSPLAGAFITENTEVTLTAELDGETKSCSFLLEATNVRPALAISCPGDQQENADVNDIFEIPDYTNLVNIANSCGNINVTQSPIVGTDVGENTTVTLSAVDERGVSVDCEFEVILNFIDPNAPEIDCVNHELFLDENGQAVLNPGDLLVGEPGNLLITADKVNFDCTNLGANDVILTATDPETGLSSTCSASIFIIDEMFPVASCKIDYKVYLDNSGNATLAPEDLNNNSTDNCGIVSMALSQTEFTRADLGEVPITLTVRDEAGNMDFCETTVEVVEEASGNFECRESIVVYLDENGEAGLGLEELYTGNASGITLEASQLRFNCNDVGEVSVQLDYSGAQTGSCSISVEVRDEIAPEIITDVVELSLDAEGFAYLEENDVLVQDNCSREFVYRFGKSVFSCEDVGSNTINVEVEDINANIATKNIEVRVNGEACETPDDLKFLFIYPNPNNGIFTIVTPDGMTVEKVRVFDSRGRYILQQNYNVSGRFYRMSIEAVAESVYTLQIFTNKGIVVKRVIVSR
ncbi:T9SS type A sorting domain-containing protein [Salegentibacter maritimus]|uniref:T9SS type A sorting domain-containing protein n=1 Tax=Salegentibacter maritimus TaxID=2794347 RepID=A0ABS0TGQ1_9FLAO|nr:T9SS type A sorting domain-containing protein [Salegentibacter maritimus]MBI6120239.1 T9SS type A sorting domain-containing protein [Salegentibacter maritimus]